jgi:FkbM family methyltransferase
MSPSAVSIEFSSPATKRIVEATPQFRGSCLIGSWILRLLPFLDKKAYLKFGQQVCFLDAGYVTHYGFLRSRFEPLESRIILRFLREGDVFFDIGSNWGYYAFLGSVSVGLKGTVVAVEANPLVFTRLLGMTKAAGLTNVLPFNFAMSDTAGENVVIRVPWYRVDTGGFIKTRGHKGNVRSSTIDLLWQQLGRPLVRMIKIDTEGAEPLILKGGAHFFKEGLTDAALIEIGAWSRERFGIDPTDIYRKMADFGFSYCYGVYNQELRLLETPVSEYAPFFGNVLFCRKQLLDLNAFME